MSYKVVDIAMNPNTDERSGEDLETGLSLKEAFQVMQDAYNDLCACPDQYTHDIHVIDEELDEILETRRAYYDGETEEL